jgi:hypothetical protein
MKAYKEKLKNADYMDILHNLTFVTEEISNIMNTPFKERIDELLEFKKEMLEELDRRSKNKR